MTQKKKLYMLAGDGIGPEVMREVLRVVDWMNRRRKGMFEVGEGLVGGAALDAHGTPLTDEAMADAAAADAVLFGAVGGPKWDSLPPEKRPEGLRGLLRLREEMDLFAKICPAHVHPMLADASSLKPEFVSGLDLVIVREIRSGIYFGEPRGIQTLEDGTRRGVNTEAYTAPEVERVARVAFEVARKRGRRVCSVDKANVLESSRMWREEVQRVRDAEYQDVVLSHMYVDNASMQLIRRPKQFDVILTTNMFGDILSDASASLTGSLGMLPSAELGERNSSGKQHAMYQPIHGSAPDIAGKNVANPIGNVLSFAMALRYSFDMLEDAALVESAVRNVLDNGFRTADIMGPGNKLVSTSGMGSAIVDELGRLAE